MWTLHLLLDFFKWGSPSCFHVCDGITALSVTPFEHPSSSSAEVAFSEHRKVRKGEQGMNELKRNFTQVSRQLVLVLKHAADGGKKRDTSDQRKVCQTVKSAGWRDREWKWFFRETSTLGEEQGVLQAPRAHRCLVLGELADLQDWLQTYVSLLLKPRSLWKATNSVFH